ncbi:MAG: hypothetical protein ACKO37_06850 [Vampirovibrionales bacterium]
MIRTIYPFVPTSKVLAKLSSTASLIRKKDGQAQIPYATLRQMSGMIKQHGVAGVYIDPREYSEFGIERYDELFLNTAARLKKSLNRYFNLNPKYRGRFGVTEPGGNDIRYGVNPFHNDGGKMAGIMYYPKRGLKLVDKRIHYPFPTLLGGYAQVAPHYSKEAAITFPTAQKKFLFLYMYGGKGGLSHRATPTLLPYQHKHSGKIVYLDYATAQKTNATPLPDVHRGVNNVFYERGMYVASWDNP